MYVLYHPRFLKGQIMTCICVLKHRDLVTTSDATKHILPCNSAEEAVIDYFIHRP